MTEHLTQYTQELLASARGIFGPKNPCVINTIVTVVHKGLEYSIRCSEDLDLLKSMVNFTPALSSASSNSHPNDGTVTLPPSQPAMSNSPEPSLTQPSQTVPLTGANTSPLGSRVAGSTPLVPAKKITLLYLTRFYLLTIA